MSRGRVAYPDPSVVTVEGVPEEIFVFADDEQDARRIDRMNGEQARILKHARLKAVAEIGRVPEVLMPGTFMPVMDAVYEEHNRRLRDAEGEAQKGEYHPRKLVANVDRIEIESNSEGTLGTRGHVKVDGKEIRGIQRVTIDIVAGELPKVSLELWPTRPGETTP